MAIAVNDEGVRALQDFSARIEEGVEAIKGECDKMTGIVDQYSGKIGPHAGEIKSALDEIKGAILRGTVPAHNVSEKLLDVADAYQEIIDTQYYGNLGN